MFVNCVSIFVDVFVGVVIIVLFVIWEMSCFVNVDLLCLCVVVIVVMFGGMVISCFKSCCCFGCGVLVVGY